MSSSPPSDPPEPPSASSPGGRNSLHRLLVRVQRVELEEEGREDLEGQQPPQRLRKDRVCDVVALPETTARSICRTLVEAEMPAVREEVLERYALVMVYPTRETDGSLTHILHTLQPEERLIPLVEGVLARSELDIGGFTEEQLLEEHLISWFLKDLFAAPLDFRGYVSGEEASEDEIAAPWYSDMNQIGQGYYSGYLLKKSSRDPCLWRRRWCILGEDKIWYMKLKHRRTQGKAAFISLVSNQVLEHPRNSEILFGIEVHTAHRVFLFRAADRSQQLGWIKAIQTRINLASENDLISMAELMICDEEQARARRLEQAIEHVWTGAGINRQVIQEEADVLLNKSSSSSSGGGGRRRAGSSDRRVQGRQALFARGGDLGEALAFTVAVQEFKELCRQELTPNENKWGAAEMIFDEFLRDRKGIMMGVGAEAEEGQRDEPGQENRGDGMITSSPIISPDKKMQQSSEQQQERARLFLPREGRKRRRPLFRLQRNVIKDIQSQLLEYGSRIRERQVVQGARGQRKQGEGRKAIPRLLGGVIGGLTTAVAAGTGTGSNGGGDGASILPPPPRSLFDTLLEGIERSDETLL